jgi:hypothetical protein
MNNLKKIIKIECGRDLIVHQSYTFYKKKKSVNDDVKMALYPSWSSFKTIPK